MVLQRGLVLPALYSARASLASVSSFPSRTSCSSCRSQTAQSNSRNQSRNSRSSSRESVSTCFSRSLTLLMVQPLRAPSLAVGPAPLNNYDPDPELRGPGLPSSTTNEASVLHFASRLWTDSRARRSARSEEHTSELQSHVK